MSHAEALGWAAYVKKRGSLSVAARLEIGFGMLAALIINRTGGRADPRDFMPHFGASDDEDEEATLDDVMNALMGARR